MSFTRISISIPDATKSVGLKHGPWDIYALSTPGAAHLRKGRQSDDAFAMNMVGSYLVAVASDGAGSARCGAEGSNLLAHGVTEFIAERLENGTVGFMVDSTFENEWRALIEAAVANVRDKILKDNNIEPTTSQIAQQETILRDYHATLVGIVTTEDSGLFFHIGDGLCVTFDLPLNFTAAAEAVVPAACSLPQKGEHYGETYFFSMQDWRSYLRLTFFKPASIVLLMSDGVSSFVLHDDNLLYGPFIRPIAEYLTGADDHNLAAKKLLDTLTCAQANECSDDDKTLLWLSRTIPPVL